MKVSLVTGHEKSKYGFTCALGKRLINLLGLPLVRFLTPIEIPLLGRFLL